MKTIEEVLHGAAPGDGHPGAARLDPTDYEVVLEYMEGRLPKVRAERDAVT